MNEVFTIHTPPRSLPVNAVLTLNDYKCRMDVSVPLHQQGPVVDKAHLERMTGGDHELALEVLGLFREQVELWSKLLQPSTETEDWGNAAHTVKGAARGIGAWQLGEVCGQAEEASKSRPLSRDEKRAFYEAITTEMQSVIGEIAVIEHQYALASLR
jgi:HPt (histidine-containing phosphotransfer) domain-containing protein